MTGEDENVVYIGDKDVSEYYTAAMIQLERNDSVHVRGRGRRFVGKAVDLAEIVRRDTDGDIDSISTDTHRQCADCDVVVEDGDVCPSCGNDDDVYGSSTIDIHII